LNLTLTLLDGDLAVARLEEAAGAPAWAVPSAGGLLAVVGAPGETTVVCDAGAVPTEVQSFGPWRALAVAGPLEFTMTGVLAAIAAPLAAVGVSIFAISTFDTDYVLVPSDRAKDAVAALRADGLRVAGAGL
jgi:uncharacterized protein